MDGVQFRYTCPYCKLMPAKRSHWWRLSKATGLGGSAQDGSWAMPCCGKAWAWATCGGARTFSLLQPDGTWAHAYIGLSGNKQTD
eukprot:669053-Lingulodinium_polyedra.AAC.1